MLGGMRILTGYLAGRMAAALGVALLLFVGLIWVLHLLRLGHHLLGGPDLELAQVGRLLLYSLPSLLVFALPLALTAGLLFTLAQLAESGELTAMRAAGASPAQLARPGLLLTLLVVTCIFPIAAWLEGPALVRLQRSLAVGAARALVLGAKPGLFHALGGGTTLYLESRRATLPQGAVLQGVLLAEEDPPRVLLARTATLHLDGQAARLVLQLEQGELQQLNPEGGLRRVRFATLEHVVDLGRALEPHFGFLGRRAHGPRRGASAAANGLALGLLATALGLGLRRRLPMALLGILALLAYQLGSLGLERVWEMGPPAIAGATVLFSLLWLAHLTRHASAAG